MTKTKTFDIIHNTINNNEPWYLKEYLFSLKTTYQYVTAHINNYILENIDSNNLYFFCSWFISDELQLEKCDYNCLFYDINPQVVKYNRLVSDKVYDQDVVFERVENINGLIINKHANHCYPLGKLYKNDFILVGYNDKQLYYVNQYNKIEDLIDNNDIKHVYYKHTKTIDNNEIYIVHGSNI